MEITISFNKIILNLVLDTKLTGPFEVSFRRAVKTKAPLRVQFLPTFGGEGEEQEALALLSKKRGRGGSIESQQKL